MAKTIRVAVVGVGRFGENHARIYSELPDVDLVGIFDADPARAREMAAKYQCQSFARLQDMKGQVDAATVSVPTQSHSAIAVELLESGVDVLVEKPLASSVAEADEMVATASGHNRILQVGHLERFNPAVAAARSVARVPLFFEAHRLSPFSPRSLDVDVVLDLMIHDLDIVLSLIDSEVKEIRAVGLPVLTPKIDIANVRIEFANACVANFTASRVSTERVRKLRWFQASEYVSLDYDRQDAFAIAVRRTPEGPSLEPRQLHPVKQEPLRAQLEAFIESVRTRKNPQVDGTHGRRALHLAHLILSEITLHGDRLMQAQDSFSMDHPLHASAGPMAGK
ncbi:MAG: Gfo/Idh/MocA family oxidoreductase [Acidobacteria bacterium]|nr:Gfo/Idh/MocA family oxidoreductase [Acidobacteriota bacterium]